MDKIVDRLYVGDLQDAAALTVSNPEIITAVLNVCETPDNFSSMPLLRYAHIPFADGHSIPREEFNLCMKWLSDRYNAHSRILIHCHLGVSRSPTICAAFLASSGIVSNIDSGFQLVKYSRLRVDPSDFVFTSAKLYLLEKGLVIKEMRK